jgi:GGDEF domain-containing protein
MAGSQRKQKDNELLIEKELLTVIASLRLKIERREAVFSLLQEDDEAPFQQVVTYFLDGEVEREQARKIWSVLLEYRRDMTKTYGDRVSLHIAAYHLSRDPHTLTEKNLPDDLACSKLAQYLAIQEMKAWWERCSETGVHLREVMEEQLERLVYQGLKKQYSLCMVLVQIRHSSRGCLTKEEKIDFARFLMDACRCRDIVGHYQEDRFALIFPQTPRPGARIALDRLHKFFGMKYEQQQYFFDAALVNCPDNGRKGRDLFLIAGDHLKKIAHGPKDHIIECEGEPRALYKWWVFHLRQPLYKFIRSPLQILAAVVLIGCGIWAVEKLSFERITQWEECFKQVINESRTLPRWRWGRGNGESFAIDARDGLLEDNGALVCESGEGLWYQFPLEVHGEGKIEFKFRLALGSTFSLSCGDHPQDEFLALKFEAGWCKLISKGIVMEVIPLTMDFEINHTASIALLQEGLKVTLDDQILLENGRWGTVSPWPNKGYVYNTKGYSLVWDLRVLSRGNIKNLDWAEHPWALEMEKLPLKDPAVWAEMLLRAPARLETVLRANLQRQLELIADNSKNHQSLRRSLMEKWGEGVLGGAELWKIWLKGQKAIATKDHWGEDLLLRSPTLKEIHRAAQSPTPFETLKDYTQRELWGISKFQFLQVVLALDWESHRLAISQWAWIEIVNMLDEISELDALSACIDFLRDELTPEDPIWTSRVCEKLIFMGKNNYLDVYRAIVAQPFALAAVASWPPNRTDPLIMLIQARALPQGPAKSELLESLSPWMNNSEIGKLLKLDWMWLTVENEGLTSPKTQFMQQRLKYQSRRPELARQILLLGEGRVE